MSLIDIRGLTVKYVGRKNPTLVNVNLELQQGETVLLLGASGSGKSTLALTLNGLIPHSTGGVMSGSVCVAGMDTQQASVAQLAQQVGIVFQDPESQFVTLKVEDEIAFGLENLRLPPHEMDAKIQTALDQVSMPQARTQAVWALSGGQKQRIALAALLAMEPHVIVFDEPTANLDPIGTRDVFALLAEHKARPHQPQHTIILIEHKLDEVMHLIDRVVVLGEGGSVIADAPPREMFDQHAETLRALGVWMPQVSLLAHKLGVRPVPVTLDEAVRQWSCVIGHLPFASGEGQMTHDKEQMTNDSLAIEVRHLSHRYGANETLRDVSVCVPTGDFLAIVGANGAGKTTLAKHLMTILHPPKNTVFIEGRDVAGIPSRELTRLIGYVFQNPEHQFVTNSVADEVRFGLRVMGLSADEIEQRTHTMLTRFKLSRYAQANPFTLSHGEKRRLSVATMLAMGQRILILDEPTFGQDQRNAAELLAVLDELHDEGRTIIVITHDMALVAQHAHTVAVMSEGRLLFHGAVREAFAQPHLLREARLTLPPIAQLAERVPALQGVLTLDDAAHKLQNHTHASLLR
jgi:energy-coupling factor transport system ATP-binding protein